METLVVWGGWASSGGVRVGGWGWGWGRRGGGGGVVGEWRAFTAWSKSRIGVVTWERKGGEVRRLRGQ